MDIVRQMLLLGGLLNILSGLLAIAKPDVFRLLDKRFDLGTAKHITLGFGHRREIMVSYHLHILLCNQEDF